MTRQIFWNGGFVQEDEARIPVMDRGLLLGDAIYEVTAMVEGRLIDNDLHLARLARSLDQLGIPLPMPMAQIKAMQRELVERHGMTDGTIYLQVSRGTEERNFLPSVGLQPNFLAFLQPKDLTANPALVSGVKVALLPDPRWVRRDIKTVMLLGQVMLKQQARDGGFDDVWMHEEGSITEGGSSTAFGVTREGRLVTRPNSHAILPGCTRQRVLEIAKEGGIPVDERPIAVSEVGDLAEAFLTSASSLVQPVVQVGSTQIADGAVGPMTRRLQQLYLDFARSGDRII